MVDLTKPMNAVRDVQRAVSRDIDALDGTVRFTKECAAMKEAFVGAANAFNAMRAELEKAKNCVFKMNADAAKFVSTVTSMNGRDCMSYVAKCWDVPLSDVEDTEKFECVLADISKASGPLLRMRKCVKAKIAIDSSLAGWESKMAAMRERKERIDANPNEAEICERKIFTMLKIVGTMKARRDTVTKIFHEQKRDILGFVEKQSAIFSK